MRKATCWKARPPATWCIAVAWPGIMRTVYGDHQRFVDTYFKTYPGKYFTGDGAGATPTATTGSLGASTM